MKYFSGTGTYTNTLQVPAEWFRPGTHLWISLGEVKNLAEVSVNGKPLGIVWHAPYRVDATAALKPGSNEISIKVTNAWVNRLIGDQQPNSEKFTFTVIHPYNAQSPLLPSGLLGPVEILSIKHNRSKIATSRQFALSSTACRCERKKAVVCGQRIAE